MSESVPLSIAYSVDGRCLSGVDRYRPERESEVRYIYIFWREASMKGAALRNQR